jgi:hypothetical protein
MEDDSQVESPPQSPENAESPSKKKGKGFWRLRGKKSMGGLRSVTGAIFKSRDRAQSKSSDQGYMPTVEERPESETGSQTSSRPASSLPGNGRQSKLSNRADPYRTSIEKRAEPERFSETSSHISSNQQGDASARQSKSSSQADYTSVEEEHEPDRYSQTSSRSPDYRPAKHSRNIPQPRFPAPDFPLEERKRIDSDVFSQNTNQPPHFNDPDDVLAPGEVYEHNPEMKSTQEQAKEYCDLIGSFNFDDDSAESDTTPTEYGTRWSRMTDGPSASSKPPPSAAPRLPPSRSHPRPRQIEKPLKSRPETPRVLEEMHPEPRPETTERSLRTRPERSKVSKERMTNPRPENIVNSPRIRAERPRDPEERITNSWPGNFETPPKMRPDRPRLYEERLVNPRPENIGNSARISPRIRPERPRVPEGRTAERDIYPSPEPMNAVQQRIRDLERGNMRGSPPSQITPDIHANASMIALQRLCDIHLEGLRDEEAKLEESKRGLASSRPYNVQSTGTRRSDRDIEDETLSKARPRVRSNTKKMSPKGQTGLGLEFAAMKM